MDIPVDVPLLLLLLNKGSMSLNGRHQGRGSPRIRWEGEKNGAEKTAVFGGGHGVVGYIVGGRIE